MQAQFWVLRLYLWIKMDENTCLHGADVMSFDFHLYLGT